MKQIYNLCPSLIWLGAKEELDALVRMSIAHVLNGGEYKGIEATAITYLESLNVMEIANERHE